MYDSAGEPLSTSCRSCYGDHVLLSHTALFTIAYTQAPGVTDQIIFPIEDIYGEEEENQEWPCFLFPIFKLPRTTDWILLSVDTSLIEKEKEIIAAVFAIPYS